ncbi:MAG: ATP-binding protein [Candidatus Omnitrophota bacterium]|jgi:ATP-dependent DNA helicase RecG
MKKNNFRNINKKEFKNILLSEEGDYSDFANSRICGKRLQEKTVAFANSEGGCLYVGIHDRREGKKDRNDGFNTVEDANRVIDAIYRDIKPAIENLDHKFLNYKGKFILKIEVPSSATDHATAKGKVLIRKGAEIIPLKSPEEIRRLRYKKGIYRYEDEIKSVDLKSFLNSNYFKDFLRRISFPGTRINYLTKNNFIYNKKPKISAVLCFLDNPQTVIKSGIKIIRYDFQKNPRKYEYRRERVSNKDYTIIGPIEKLIRESIKRIDIIMKELNIRYPKEAIVESVVNAVIHRDYYIQNEIQIKIYDNQVEIISPGGFAGGITSENISEHARFCRNPILVNTLYKISSLEKHKRDRLSQDQGEGIKTIVRSMRTAGLADPIFKEVDDSVIVTLKHANAESYENKVIEHLKVHNYIANKEARKITGEEDKEKIKNVFKKLIKRDLIEVVDKYVPKSKIQYKLKGKNIIKLEDKQPTFGFLNNLN